MKLSKILVVGLALFSTSAFSLSKRDMIQGTGFVYRVVDGDTYIVNVDSSKVYAKLKGEAKTRNELQHFNDKYRAFKIRLGNIDTAESKHVDASRNSQLGIDTSAYVKKKLSKQKIGFTCWDFGKYGRAICSVTLGGKDLGLHLLKMNYSTYYTKFGAHPYLDDEYTKASNR